MTSHRTTVLPQQRVAEAVRWYPRSLLSWNGSSEVQRQQLRLDRQRLRLDRQRFGLEPAAAQAGPEAALSGPSAARAGPVAARAGPAGARARPAAARAGPTAAQTGPAAARAGPVAARGGHTHTHTQHTHNKFYCKRNIQKQNIINMQLAQKVPQHLSRGASCLVRNRIFNWSRYCSTATGPQLDR